MRVVLRLPSGEGIARAVEAEAIHAGRLVAVVVHDLQLTRTFRSIRLRRQTPSPAVLALLAMLAGERHRTRSRLRGRPDDELEAQVDDLRGGVVGHEFRRNLADAFARRPDRR